MAKKLNKKVAVIGIVLLGLIIASGCGGFIFLKIHRSPDRALKLYQEAMAAGDYLEAENQLGRAYAFGKTDEDKTQRLFELAEFHQINNEQHEADWTKVLGCWNAIIKKTDPDNIEARRLLLDYFYQAADAGQYQVWRNIEENTKELIETLQKQSIEPDTFYLMARAKALLSIARRGETTNRRELLDECIELLNQLLEREPQNPEFYRLMAEAITVDGELNALSGIMNATETAQEKAIEVLETSIQQADDKATATADLMVYKIQSVQNDPNALEAIRAEIDERCKQITPNGKLWQVVSLIYGIPGKMSAEAETNRAIEAIRSAHELEPDNFEYVLGLSRLMYRKGSAFDDAAALEDALQIAESALEMEAVQDVPGPLQGRNRNYRYILNNYLADLYLQSTIKASDNNQTGESQEYIQKAEARIEEIISTLGTEENPVIYKYQGLVALAKGQSDRAVSLLYKAYEQNKALDKANEASNVDALVCVALAKMAEQEKQWGLVTEFLSTARNSRDRYVLQNPQIELDFAEAINKLRNFRGWATVVEQLVMRYQNRYGVNEQSGKLLVETAIAYGDFDKAKERIASYKGSANEKLQYELNLLVMQSAQLKRTIAALEEDKKEPSAEQIQKLETLRRDRDSLLEKILQTDPKGMNQILFRAACLDLIENGHSDRAVGYIDTYLAAHPNALNIITLRVRAQQDDPMNLAQQQTELYLQAIDSLPDAKQKALIKAEHYRSLKEYDKAIEILEQDPQINAEDDPDIIQARFEIALEQKDLSKAEKLFQVIRSGNIDKCNGNLAAARLEIVKENYELALRRLDECLQLQPLTSYLYMLKSQVQNKIEDMDGSIENAKTAIRMDPKNALYARNLATIYWARNTALGSKVTMQQRTEAEQAILLATQLNPMDTQLQSVYSEVIYEKNPDQAFKIRQDLLERDPSAMNAMMLAGMALRMAGAEWDPVKKTGLMELAGKAYEQGMEIDPSNEVLRQAYADYLQQSGKEGAIDVIGPDKNMEWKFYLRNGQFEKAETLLNELLQENPDDSLLVQGLVLVSQRAGKRDQLKQYLDKLAQIDDTKEIELWILQKYIDSGFAEEAEKRLAGFKERYPDDTTALLIEAWTKMGKGQLDEALEMTNRYLETNTNNSGAWRLRGRLYRLMNQPRKAIDDLQRSKNLQDTSEVRMELATVYSQLNQNTAAIGELVSSLDDPQAPMNTRTMLENLYQRDHRASDLDKFYISMIEKYPENPFWYLRAGRYYMGQKDYSKAETHLQKALELSHQIQRPSTLILDYYLESLYQSGQYEKGIKIGSNYVDGPLAYIAYSHMGEIYVKLNRREKAIESFHKALDKAGTNDATLNNVMRVMIKTIGPDEVTSWVSERLNNDSTVLSAHLLAANMAQMEGSYNKAIEHTDQCIERVAPDTQESLVYTLKKINLLIMAYAKTADQDYFNRSADLLKKILERQPNNPSLLNNLAYLLTDNDQQLETALEYARKAHQFDPGNPIYLDTYAYAQCKNGQYEQAKENLLWAIQIYEAADQSVPWDLYMHMAMAQEGLGATDRAIEMYQKAMETTDEIPEVQKQNLQKAVERLQQL